MGSASRRPRVAGYLDSLGSMPIVTVELVAESDHGSDRNLAQALADAVGHALASPPGQTWVRLRWLASHEYAENESPVSTDQLPVLVSVVKRQLPPASELQAEVSALTEAVAKTVGRPAACVHVAYEPAAAGRLSFGGKLVQ